jgi:hypothetical protein
MSIVSGVTLICGFQEHETWRTASHEEVVQALLAEFNAQLFTDGGTPIVTRGLKEVSDHYGYRHPQHYTFGGGINYLDEDRFAAYVMARKWAQPDRVVLVIQPEHTQTRVWRPMLPDETAMWTYSIGEHFEEGSAG